MGHNNHNSHYLPDSDSHASLILERVTALLLELVSRLPLRYCLNCNKVGEEKEKEERVKKGKEEKRSWNARGFYSDCSSLSTILQITPRLY